jgi:hypothetical protein
MSYFNCLNQNWASEIALRGVFFLVFCLFFYWGEGVINYLFIKAPGKKNDEPSDMVRILSEIEKCTSNINFDG